MKAVVALAVAAGCAPGTPDAPTWLADVRPILASSCIRCHDGAGLGGAPTSFRLDVLEDSASGRGARSMAPFIAARAATLRDMPPRGPTLSERQRDILARWAAAPDEGARPANRPPAAAIDEIGEDAVTVTVRDDDRDLVTGTLRLGPSLDLGALRDGRNVVAWDARFVPNGVHALSAVLDDGSGPVAVPLGTATVAHEGDALPAISFLGPAADDLFARDEEIAFVLESSAGDPAVDVAAVSGETVVPLVAAVRPSQCPCTVASPALAPAGSWRSWRLRATLPRQGTVLGESPQFYVSDATTTETWATVRPIVDGLCARCHDGSLVSADFRTLEGLRAYRGRAWRKVALQREMPPRSQRAVVPDAPALSDADRARLGDWLLAGAPP